jgi:hypothetical protein
MKKIIVSVFAISFFLFVGCGEDHANGEKGRHEEQVLHPMLLPRHLRSISVIISVWPLMRMKSMVTLS